MERNKCVINGLLTAHVDNEVYQDIIKTFAKETICLLPLGNLTKTSVQNKIISQIENTEYEISHFHKYDIDCNEEKTTSLHRMPSVNTFSEKPIAFDLLKKFLINSFAVDNAGRRPYPSGGALYPVEPLVFLFEDRVEQFADRPFGCYHFRPVSKKLQFIKSVSSSWFYNDLIQGYLDEKRLPAFAIVYLAHIGKTLFKYRYRGYRHALIEVGTMCQVATTTAQEIGLRNTIWSTFSEYQLLDQLDLDSSVFMPVMMQFFGYTEK